MTAPAKLPDYWLPRPAPDPGPELAASFDAIWQRASSGGDCPLIDEALPAPRWQFLCHLTDTLGLVLHGSGSADIGEFTPRKADDLRSFGSREAVYAAGDGIWAIFYAVADRSRIPTMTNACVRLADASGVVSPPRYVFSVSRGALRRRPWREGVVYVLPGDTFILQPPLRFGEYQVLIPQLASSVTVRPLARVPVKPADFPFLDQVRAHDDDRLEEVTRALETGGPWPA